jgi:hypothetical protein
MGNKDGEKIKTKVDNIPFDCTTSEYAVQILTTAIPQLLFLQAPLRSFEGTGHGEFQDQ